MACDSLSRLMEDIESEGFDYALVHYDDYSDIPSDQFQQLYQGYLESRAKLIKFLGLPANT